MTRIFLDGITPSAMPLDYPGLAGVIGYTNGNWPDYNALVARYPGKVHVSCTVNASLIGAVILDVENGDATPQEAPGWVQRSRAAGVQGITVYCNTSTWPEVRDQFALQHVAEPLYGVAQYDGVAVIPADAIYKQYQSTPGYDVNVVADYWPGVDPDPQGAPVTATPPDLDANTNFEALIWRVEALLNNRPTVIGGPTKGEANLLYQRLAALAVPAVDVNAIAAAVVAQIGNDLK